MKTKNYAALKEFSVGLGLELFGVADYGGKDGFPFAVCVGARLSRALLEGIDGHPTRPYFHHYKTANAFLDQACLRIAAFIEQRGHSAFPVAASQILDWQKQTALLSHKHIAAAAGLGWIGRNNLLVNPELGSRLRLATLLTDMPLTTDSPLANGCGECRSCVAACPAGAIKDDPADFDHQGCFAKLKEFQKLRYTEQFICGVCIKACPGARKP